MNLLFIPAGVHFFLQSYSILANIRYTYRRNLIKEFGPKDIDKSAIFVSKKKEKNK